MRGTPESEVTSGVTVACSMIRWLLLALFSLQSAHFGSGREAQDDGQGLGARWARPWAADCHGVGWSVALRGGGGGLWDVNGKTQYDWREWHMSRSKLRFRVSQSVIGWDRGGKRRASPSSYPYTRQHSS
ncbi:uncharacterized protein LY79DRAFT_296938 [Colletotrichum navitas]|uniref:Uncharacterized protein n=1 Tax=Colletotrichum navitas TaxID=681940 RepID=A0AAD8PV99_9PEZI|nr:uncharacterized protein LY79DRAFT_296938 [Colletotrichum navitas]KAK1580754.1 hypothetical protein LY79DRAFT_296938 [Colletotrichum navitas]